VAKYRPKTPPRELSTVSDFVRYAVTRFVGAQMALGQGTSNAVEEAIFLVSEALGLFNRWYRSISASTDDVSRTDSPDAC
jgi:hypothetical protein